MLGQMADGKSGARPGTEPDGNGREGDNPARTSEGGAKPRMFAGGQTADRN
jgi:hypothetical protein